MTLADPLEDAAPGPRDCPRRAAPTIRSAKSRSDRPPSSTIEIATASSGISESTREVAERGGAQQQVIAHEALADHHGELERRGAGARRAAAGAPARPSRGPRAGSRACGPRPVRACDASRIPLGLRRPQAAAQPTGFARDGPRAAARPARAARRSRSKPAMPASVRGPIPGTRSRSSTAPERPRARAPRRSPGARAGPTPGQRLERRRVGAVRVDRQADQHAGGPAHRPARAALAQASSTLCPATARRSPGAAQSAGGGAARASASANSSAASASAARARPRAARPCSASTGPGLSPPRAARPRRLRRRRRAARAPPARSGCASITTETLISLVEISWMLMPCSSQHLEHAGRDARVVLHAEPHDRHLRDLLVALHGHRADLAPDLLGERRARAR